MIHFVKRLVHVILDMLEVNSTALLEIQATRVTMCEALTTVVSLTDASTTLVDSLTSSLPGTYDPSAVVEDSARSSCYTTLDTVLSLSESVLTVKIIIKYINHG
jgi:hypothetical protein